MSGGEQAVGGSVPAVPVPIPQTASAGTANASHPDVAERTESQTSPESTVDPFHWVIATQPDGSLDAPCAPPPNGRRCESAGGASAAGIGGATCSAAGGEWIDVDWLDHRFASVERQQLPDTPPQVELRGEGSGGADASATLAIPPLELDVLPTGENRRTNGRKAGATATVSSPTGPSAPRTAEPGQAAEPPGASDPLEGAWEVDHFRWPEMCDRLQAAERSYFEHAGEKLRGASREGLHVLAVTSCAAGEGRTTLALLLARAAAAAGARVALLEADRHAPHLAAALGINTPCAWPQALRSGLPWSEAAIVSVAERITVFPLDDQGDMEPPELRDASVTELVNRLASHFDLVVIDAPPIGGPRGEFFEIGEACPVNAAILVQDTRQAEPERTLRAVQRLHDAGLEAVGIAHNFCGSQEE